MTPSVIVLPRRFQSRGGRKNIIDVDGRRAREATAVSIGAALRRGHADLLSLNASPMTPTDQMIGCRRAGYAARSPDRAKLAYLAPDLQREILAGRISDELTLRRLMRAPMPLAWADQVEWFRAVGR
jgi:hypothetical protein